jgi:hypothetical protein
MTKDSDDGSGISGKRNKSWREIDAGRGKSKGHSRQDDKDQQRIERSPSYAKYKLAADSLFTGGKLPEGLAKTFDPDGKRAAQKDALLHIREIADDRKAWAEAIVAHLEKYPELPEDPYFLDSLLDHPKERIADKALARLEQLEVEGKLKDKAPKSLDQRLKSIAMTSMDPEMQERAKVLREKLRA